MELEPAKLEGPIEKRRKPLKDVDAAARAQFLKASSYLAAAGLSFATLIAIAGSALGLGPFKTILVSVGLGLGGPFLVYGFWYHFVIGGTVSLLGRLYVGGSSGTSPHPAYWLAESLSARGAHADALAAYERLASEDPGDPGPCLRAATLCAEELGDTAAASWYTRARNAARTTPETDAYVSVRLADLYDAQGELEPAMVELERLLDRYPDSRYAGRARNRLADIKARQVGKGRYGR